MAIHEDLVMTISTVASSAIAKIHIPRVSGFSIRERVSESVIRIMVTVFIIIGARVGLQRVNFAG